MKKTNTSDKLLLARERLTTLIVEEHRINEELAPVERRAADALRAINTAQAEVLEKGASLDRLEKAHQAWSDAQSATAVISARLARRRELVTRAAALVAAAEVETKTEYRDSLTGCHRAKLQEYARAVAVCMSLGAELSELVAEAFAAFPSGSKPGVPEAFCIPGLRPLAALRLAPLTGGDWFLREVARIFGEATLPKEALAVRAKVTQIEEEREQQERTRTAKFRSASSRAKVGLDIRASGLDDPRILWQDHRDETARRRKRLVNRRRGRSWTGGMGGCLSLGWGSRRLPGVGKQFTEPGNRVFRDA